MHPNTPPGFATPQPPTSTAEKRVLHFSDQKLQVIVYIKTTPEPCPLLANPRPGKGGPLYQSITCREEKLWKSTCNIGRSNNLRLSKKPYLHT